jgi:hypothetical protein
MKPVGEPDAGNPHVRFDERGAEKGAGLQQLSHRATPRLYRISQFGPPCQQPGVTFDANNTETCAML